MASWIEFMLLFRSEIIYHLLNKAFPGKLCNIALCSFLLYPPSLPQSENYGYVALHIVGLPLGMSGPGEKKSYLR